MRYLHVIRKESFNIVKFPTRMDSSMTFQALLNECYGLAYLERKMLLYRWPNYKAKRAESIFIQK